MICLEKRSLTYGGIDEAAKLEQWELVRQANCVGASEEGRAGRR